jgi:hypothetical protein
MYRVRLRQLAVRAVSNYPRSPFLGGVLSRPHDHLPAIFAAPFWTDYPYFLPCLAAASFSLAAAVLVLLFFREVRPLVHLARLRHPP